MPILLYAVRLVLFLSTNSHLNLHIRRSKLTVWQLRSRIIIWTAKFLQQFTMSETGLFLMTFLVLKNLSESLLALDRDSGFNARDHHLWLYGRYCQAKAHTH